MFTIIKKLLEFKRVNGLKAMFKLLFTYLCHPQLILVYLKSIFIKSNQVNNEVVMLGKDENRDEKKRLTEKLKTNKTIAVQVHIYYLDLIEEIIEKLNHIPYKYDLFISCDNIEKKKEISKYVANFKSAEKIEIEVYENKGRDVYPFLRQMQAVYKDYEYLLHIHTKKSLTYLVGNRWRDYLFESLLGSESVVEDIMYNFLIDKKIGLIYPDIYEEIKTGLNYGFNIKKINELALLLNIDHHYHDDDENILFPAGDMFYCRIEAVKNIFELDLNKLEIPEEKGQLDGTMMHAIERMWTNIANYNGYKTVLYKTNIN